MGDVAKILEAIMVISFGISWPMSCRKKSFIYRTNCIWLYMWNYR